MFSPQTKLLYACAVFSNDSLDFLEASVGKWFSRSWSMESHEAASRRPGDYI